MVKEIFRLMFLRSDCLLEMGEGGLVTLVRDETNLAASQSHRIPESQYG